MKTNRLNPFASLSFSVSKKETFLRLQAAWRNLECHFSKIYLEICPRFLNASVLLDPNLGLKRSVLFKSHPHSLTPLSTLRKTSPYQWLIPQLTSCWNFHRANALSNRPNTSTNKMDCAFLLSAQQVTLGFGPLSSIKLYKMGKQLVPCVLDGFYSHGLSLKMEF